VAVFQEIEQYGHEQIVFCNEPSVGLKAIIAIHDTTLGPALGGCRFWNYSNESDALTDVLRLSRGMTYKAAVAGLHLGGGKAVIIGDPKKLKSEAFFRTFGRFVDSLRGRYITAEDVNINVNDVDYIVKETDYVTGVRGKSGDPSPITAFGTYAGIKAAVSHKLGKKTLSGIRIAVQGCGAVGYYLCELLAKEGAQLFVTDIDDAKIRRCVEDFGAEACDPAKIHSLDVDVYAPCALGAIINDTTIAEMKAPIIAGAANNQLADEQLHGKQLMDRSILYAPDYVINAGGLINVYHELRGYQEASARKQVTGIEQTLEGIFNLAEKEGIPTQNASNRIAEDRIAQMRSTKSLRNYAKGQVWA
jgi:leucine dehydrogenase